MNRRKLLHVLPLAPLGALGLPALAEEANPQTSPAYNIELILFRNTGSLASPESWAAEASGTGEGDVAGAETPQGGGSRETARFLTALPASAYQLGEIESKLRSSGSFVPVAHAAWSQTASTWGTRGGFPVQRLGIEAAGLSGNVYLERGQFLHLGLALNYAIANPAPALQAAPGTVFTIHQSQRVKFYDRVLFDHPAFGVIALVSPAQGKRPPGR
jgi:hypothetical protein